MKKTKKIKQIIVLVCIVLVVALLAAMPLIAKQEPEEDGPKASILSNTVLANSINTELIGGGTLAEEDGVVIDLPAAVKLTEFLVANGDEVTEGTPIAKVDRVTVMMAISQVQETLEYLSEQIEAASDTDSKERVTALAGGIVKTVYAQEGASVQTVMLEHGALAVLSLDGLMAVDLTTESTLTTGSAVTVTLSDGTAVTGKVVKNLAGEMTVTLEDDGYSAGEEVTLTDSEGAEVGTGVLYIYSPWNATAYAGTVDSIKVKVGDKLTAGKTLMVLRDVGYSATYGQLVGQRQEYEALMLELFKMYQTETVTAPCDGVVSGIDKNSAQLLSGEGRYTIRFLANSPNGDDETLYATYVGKLSAVASNGWMMTMNPQKVMIADYKDLSGLELNEDLMTETVLHIQNDSPVYMLKEGAWVQVEPKTVGAGDLLLFAYDSKGELVWSVLLEKAEQQPEGPDDSEEQEKPGQGNIPSNPNGNFPSGGMGGGFPNGGTQEESFELYSLDMVSIASVTPQSTMTLEIAVDEQDVKALQVGMTAQVKIDALGGQKFTATIAMIGNTGTNNGGSSKYTVELTMERAENMLSGMNATATIVLATTGDVMTIPADALVEQGNQTIVYTGYDEKKEALTDPVVVKVGKSDGETVEILEGLTDGQTYYYAYYDTLEISNTPDFGGGGFFGR